MTTQMTTDTQEFMTVDKFINDSYLDYAMYSILDRALPHIGDGLKPVHRRIIYAMHGLNLNHLAKYKKSARTIGDTLGKYHPHGDSACYEAMVLMAQNFSTRIPLVDGQGNWGSPDDPKSFAAMRYTEAKLTPYATSLLSEIDQGTVEWKGNFDGTMKEPVVLPAQLPNVLINGSIGIAVGMATSIPAHNIHEVTQACIRVLENPDTTNDDILDLIPGPDYATGGLISTPKEDVRQAYKTGRGTIKLRASYKVDGDRINITSLPFQAQITKIFVNICNQMESKKLPLVVNAKDLGDEKTPINIELTLKNSKVDADAVMSHLFATAGLESNLQLNLNMIGLNGLPETKPLPNIIREWCEFRQDVFVRKTQFRLDKVIARLHIVEGLLIAYNHLDEVIRIIREEDNPKSELMNAFSLTDIQANAILDLKLRHLAKLEEETLLNEEASLVKERDELTALLADDKKIKLAVVAELKVALNSHDSPRRTEYTDASPASAISAAELIAPANTTVIISKNNWIKAAKGHDFNMSSLNYKSGDSYKLHLETRTNVPTIIMSKEGRFFSLDTLALPNAKGVGEPLSTKITLASSDDVHSALPLVEDKMLLITTAKGKGFVVPMANLNSKAKKGKHVLNVSQGDSPLTPIILDKEQTNLALLTQAGRLSIIPIGEINESNKSQGIRLIHVKEDEYSNSTDSLLCALPFKSGESFVLNVGKKAIKISHDDQAKYACTRGRRGTFIEHRPKRDLPMSLSYLE